MTNPRLFAHRGSCALAPENTSAAFDLALRCQADVLETDVRLSRDGVVMVTHDETLERTTNGTGRVRDHHATALQQLDAAAGFHDLGGQPYAGQRLSLLTLEALLSQYSTVGINIDIKDNDLLAAKAVADVIDKHMKNAHPAQWINVGSFHAAVTHHFRKLAPHISTAATRQEVTGLVFGTTKNFKPDYQLLQIPTSYWGIQLTGDRFIDKVHRLECEIIYWTINDASRIQQLLSKGCDGVVTDGLDLALIEFQRSGYK